MRTIKEKTRFFITPIDPKTPDKWTLLRRLSKEKLTSTAQLKLEWIIFYHTLGNKNATLVASH